MNTIAIAKTLILIASCINGTLLYNEIEDCEYAKAVFTALIYILFMIAAHLGGIYA